MKPSIVAKLEALHERHEEVQALLGDAQTIADQERFRALSREYAQLSDVSRCFTDWQQVQEDIETAQMMLDDPEMREMAQDELREAKEKSEQLEQQLQVLLLPKDPDDERNAFLEVRAGTGGDEAALFAGDLFRMYSRYAEARRWRVEIMSASEGEHGGYKEIIAKISGDGVYGRLKFESGGHRVHGAAQRGHRQSARALRPARYQRRSGRVGAEPRHFPCGLPLIIYPNFTGYSLEKAIKSRNLLPRGRGFFLDVEMQSNAAFQPFIFKSVPGVFFML